MAGVCMCVNICLCVCVRACRSASNVDNECGYAWYDIHSACRASVSTAACTSYQPFFKYYVTYCVGAALQKNLRYILQIFER